VTAWERLLGAPASGSNTELAPSERPNSQNERSDAETRVANLAGKQLPAQK